MADVNDSTPFWRTKPEIVEYDPEWPKRYELIKADMIKIFGDRIMGIHHMGSTGVPGMWGKSIIDAKIALPLPLTENDFTELSKLGFAHRHTPSCDTSLYIRFDGGDPVDKCLHFVPAMDDNYLGTIKMKLYLKNHPEAREAYSNTKREIITTDPGVSMLDYRSGKQGVLAQLMDGCAKWWEQLSPEDRIKYLESEGHKTN